MKKEKHIWIYVTVITLVVLLWLSLPIVFIATLCFGMVRFGAKDVSYISLYYDNAPSGTCYMDVLIKNEPDDEYYTDFNAPPRILKGTKVDKTKYIRENIYSDLPVTADSEIARYNDEGYISASLHLSNAKMEISSDEYVASIGESEPCSSLSFHDIDSGWLYEKYRDAKIAYVDENGNILSVSKKAKKDWDLDKGYAFMADGNNLTFVDFEHSPLEKVLLAGGLIGAPALFLIIPLIFIILLLKKFIDNRRAKNRQLTEGEVSYIWQRNAKG